MATRLGVVMVVDDHGKVKANTTLPSEVNDLAVVHGANGKDFIAVATPQGIQLYNDTLSPVSGLFEGSSGCTKIQCISSSTTNRCAGFFPDGSTATWQLQP